MRQVLFDEKKILAFVVLATLVFALPIALAQVEQGQQVDIAADRANVYTDTVTVQTETVSVEEPRDEGVTTGAEVNEAEEGKEERIIITNPAGDVIEGSRESLGQEPINITVVNRTEEELEEPAAEAEETTLEEGVLLECLVREAENDEVSLECEVTTAAVAEEAPEEANMTNETAEEETAESVAEEAVTDTQAPTEENATEETASEEVTTGAEEEVTEQTGSPEERRMWWNPFTWFRRG